MSLIDSLLNPLERLINEHGSAVILRERMEFIKTKLAEEESRYQELEAENLQMKAKLQEAEDRARKFETELQVLKSGQHTGFACDACGSANVRRTGSAPNPVFGVLGGRDVSFTCQECSYVSTFLVDPVK